MDTPSRSKVDQVLLTALVCGGTVESAARKAGVSARTVYRRLSQARFQERLRRCRRDLVERTSGLLTGAALGAVKTLVDLQQDPAAPATVKRRAARDILELGLRFRDTTDLEERISRLEQGASGDANGLAGRRRPIGADAAAPPPAPAGEGPAP